MKNKAFMQGLILGAGQIGGKLLSLAFLFIMANKVKPIGLYFYTYAYIPFSLFLDLSSFGIIPGTSKAISKLLANNKDLHVNYLLKTGTVISIVLGVLFFIIVNLFSQYILKVTLYSGYTKEEYDIILNNLNVASFSLLIYPLLSFYKGYLQGHLRMLPSAIAIIVENFIRLAVFILLSNINKDIFSKIFIINFFAYLIPLFIMFCFVFKDYFKNGIKFKSILYLYKTIIPFGTATFFFTIYQLIDSMTLSKIDPHIYTTYMFETTRLIFIPIIICQAIGGVITPKINYLYSNKIKQEANSLAKGITNLSIFFLMPIIYIFINYSKDIYILFYGEGNYYILSQVAVLIFFIGFYKILIGLSQGMPKFEIIVASTIISTIAKIVLNIVLISRLGHEGAIISTTTAITVNILFAYIVLNRGGIKIFIKNILIILLSILALGVSVFVTAVLGAMFINSFSYYLYIMISILFILGFYLVIITFINYLVAIRRRNAYSKIEGV